MPADAVEHELFDLGSRHTRYAAYFGLSLLHDRVRHIVPVAHAELVRVCRTHTVAAVVEDATGQNGGRALDLHLPRDGVCGELGLHGLEQVTVEDWIVLPTIHLAPVDDLAKVEPVLEQVGERSHAETDTTPLTAISTAICLGSDAAPIEFLDQGAHGTKRKVPSEDGTDRLRLRGYHDELLINAPVTKRDRSSDPDALALGGRDPVS